LGGILGSDAEHLKDATIDWLKTFEDDGIKHRTTPEERRTAVATRLREQEFAPYKAYEGVKKIVSKAPATDPNATYIPHRRARHGKAYNVPQ
jgi:hypothetical protein